MALTILDADVVGKQYISNYWKDTLNTTQDPANGQWYTNGPNNDNIGLYGGLTDALPGQPDFDTSNEQYIPTSSSGTSAIVDNSNGLEPLATVSLGFSYQQGHSTTHTTSSSVTVGTSEAISINFEVAQSNTTFSFSGTFAWSESTDDSVTTTNLSNILVPVSVPAGQIYEAQLFFTQESLIVPYTASINVTGDSETWFGSRVNGHFNYAVDAGTLFAYIGANGLAGSDSSAYGGGNGTGTVSETGTVTMYGGGAYTTKIYNITGNGDALVQAGPTGEASLVPAGASGVVSPSVEAGASGAAPLVEGGIGIKVRLGDGGETFRDTPYDDYAIGGAGNDTFLLTRGSDVAYGEGGADSIGGFGAGTQLMYGGLGDDSISAVGTGLYNQLDGGEGNDVLQANAASSVLLGGEGDDRYLLGPGAMGSRIVDGKGSNDLAITLGTSLGFERAGDSLIIHRDASPGYQPDQDVVWLDFFSGDRVNRVNGLTGEALLARSPTPQPLDAADFELLVVTANNNYATKGEWIF